MRPVAWSTSYLLRCPFGISIVTSYCTAAPHSMAVDLGSCVSVPYRSRFTTGGGFVRRVMAAVVVLVLAVGGYLTADVYDLVPGFLTLAKEPTNAGIPTVPVATPGASPAVTVTEVPIPMVAASAAAPLAAANATAPVPTTAGLTAALAVALTDRGLGSSVALTVRDA